MANALDDTMGRDDDYDDWTALPSHSGSAAKPSQIFATIENVSPLDGQIGIAEPLNVPDALREVLFGQPEPAQAGTGHYKNEQDGQPLLHTYAILDAAKVPNLPELLDTAGLPHRCLFQGDAFDQLKDVAPWVVALTKNATFTRHLFTKGDAAWHLWDKEPGIYVRTDARLEDVCAHFRKFTRVITEDGNWIYLRFWEPVVLRDFTYCLAQENLAKFVGAYCIVGCECDGRATLLGPPESTFMQTFGAAAHED